MDKITEKLVARFNLNQGDRSKNYGYFEGLLSIGVNLLLFFLKFILGTAIQSIALIADAFHTLSDVLTSVLVVVGFKIAAKPPDEKHPFGHSRAESVFALLIAFLLIGVGIEFFITSFRRFINPQPIPVKPVVIIILIFSIFIKEFLTGVSQQLGKKINSPALKADAWHHRSDAIATALVLVGFFFYQIRLFRLDGILGMGISVLIFYTGIKIIKEAGDFLIGLAPPDSLVSQIKGIAQRVEGVKNAHDIQIHDYGKRRAIILHICLRDDIQLGDAHKKAEEVERAIKEIIVDTEVTVHLEPEDEGR